MYITNWKQYIYNNKIDIVSNQKEKKMIVQIWRDIHQIIIQKNVNSIIGWTK